MSPTSRETIINKPLSGEEVKAILRADLEKLLAAECILSSHIAFGRVSYQLELRLHTGNIHLPTSLTTQRSILDPQRSPALEPPPLTPQPPAHDQNVTAHVASRNITSPNIERIRHGLPVEVRHATQEGGIERNKIIYPRDPANIPEAEGPGDVTITETTPVARADWGVLDQPLDLDVDGERARAEQERAMQDALAGGAEADAAAEAAQTAADQPPNT